MSQSKPDESLALSNTSNPSSDSSLSSTFRPTVDTPAEQTKLDWRYEEGVEAPKDETKAINHPAVPSTLLPKADTKDKGQHKVIKITSLPPKQRLLAEALFLAVDREDVEEVRGLIEQGAPLNVYKGYYMASEDDRTPLFNAVAKNNLEIVMLLLETAEGRATLCYVDQYDRTPLHLAAQNGYCTIMAAALSSSEGRTAINQTTTRGETPLFLAIKASDFALVTMLLGTAEGRAAINHNTFDVTPLLFAVEMECFEIGVQLLLHGASFQEAERTLEEHLSSKEGSDEALISEITNLRRMHARYLELLAISNPGKPDKHDLSSDLITGSGPDISEDNTAGSLSIAGGSLTGPPSTSVTIKAVAPTPSKPETKEQNGFIRQKSLALAQRLLSEALFTASAKGDAKAVQKLIKQGAPLNVKDGLGQTLLFIASEEGHPEVVNTLLQTQEGRAMVSQTNGIEKSLYEEEESSYGGETPLFAAAEAGHSSIVTILLNTPEGRATIAQTNRRGETPLFAAVREGRFAVVETLLKDTEARATINQATQKYSLIAEATINNDLTIMATLLNTIEGRTELNRRGSGPLTFSAVKGHLEMGVMLLNYGVNLEKAEKLLHNNQKKDLPKEDVQKNIQAIANLERINRRYKERLEASSFEKIETKEISSTLNNLDVLSDSSLDSTPNTLSSQPTTVSINTSYQFQKIDQDSLIRQRALPPEQRLLSEDLFASIERGEAAKVQKLIKEGVLLNVKNEYDETPLSIAAKKGDLTILTAVISFPQSRIAMRPQINGKYSDLFWRIVANNSLDVMTVLLSTPEGRAMIRQVDNKTLLLTAAACCAFREVVTLLGFPENHVTVSSSNASGNTPLSVAVDNGDLAIVTALLAIPESRATVNLTTLDFRTAFFPTRDGHRTPLYTAAWEGHIEIGVALLLHGADLQKVEDQLTNEITSNKSSDSIQALANLKFIKERYQAELVATSSNTTLSTLDSFSSSENTPPETKDSKQSETPSVKSTSSKAEIRELFDLDSFAGDTAALSEALAIPMEQQSEPLQHYLQSQAIWTVLDSEAKPAHKSAQIALLAEAPGVSLLVENEQGQLPLDVALQQLAEGQINKTAVQKLQDATQQQRAEEDEEVLQAIEIYAQAAPTATLEEKSSTRPGESKSTTDAEDGPITPRQLAAEIQKYRATEESLQQEFKVLFAPSPPSATPSSQQSRQLSKQQRNSQKNAFQKMVHQLVSKKFITSVGVGQGWVEEVSTKKAAVAKAGATFLVGTAMNIVAPGVGGVVASGGKALIEKGYSERQKTLSRKHTFGITSLKQLAMVTNHIEQCLLHRYQDFLLQQNLLLSKKAMKTFINCLIERMCLYVEKVDEPEEIIPLLSEKLINLNKWKKTGPVAAQNTPFTDAMAAQVAENLVAGTSLLHLGLIDSVKDKMRSSTDALITCLATDGSEKELHVHDICHSPAVTLTAEAEKASLQPNAITSDLAYEGRHLPGSQWSAGNYGVVCISRKEAEIENLHMTTQWDGSLPISNTQSDVVRLQARVNELEQQLAAERTKTAAIAARMTAPHSIESVPGDSKQSVFQSQKGLTMFGNSAGVGKPVRMPPPVLSFVAGEPESPVQPNPDEASGSVSSTRVVTEIPAGGF